MTAVHPTDIIVTVERPIDWIDSGWNWAEAGGDAWLAEATKAGIRVEDELDTMLDYNHDCAVIKIGGRWYELRMESDVVRAGELTEDYELEKLAEILAG